MSPAEKRIIGCFLLIIGLLGTLICAVTIIIDLLPESLLGAARCDYALPLVRHEVFMIAITHVFIIASAVGFIIFDSGRP